MDVLQANKCTDYLCFHVEQIMPDPVFVMRIRRDSLDS